jgi:hypothetical protein
MANCPHCAERLGLLQSFRPGPCPACRLPLETDQHGRIQTYARLHAQRILETPRSAGYWIMFGVAAGTTLLAVIPTLGVVPGLIVTPVQVALLVRSAQRYREHFGVLHALTTDFFAGLFFLVLFAAQAVSNLLLNVFSPLVNLPLFVGLWFGYEAYVRWHFRRVADGLPPAAAELAVIGIFAAAVLLPPTALFVAFLVSYLGGGGGD